MNLRDLPQDLSTVLHGPPLPPKVAARRLVSDTIRGGWNSEALHEYTDSDGQVLYWRIRARLSDGKKWIRPMSVRGMVYQLKEPDFRGELKPLYRVHELAAADPSTPVWWVEGEQKADQLATLGFLATTAGGANDDDGRDFEPLRKFQRIIIFRDNDAPGQAQEQRVADKVRALGGSVERIDVAALGLPEGGDVMDYVAAKPEATAADLMALPRITDGAHALPSDWPEPLPLPTELPAVEPFDLALLPEAVRPWISDIAERVQCPPDFPAVAAMVALGSVLGRKVCIRPKRHDSWYEAANLWGAIVGSPGVLKSPALNEALRPIRELENSAAEDHTQAMSNWQATKARREIARAAAKQNALKAAKKGADYSTEFLIDSDDEEPAPRRYVVNDTSVEALGEVLMRNPNGTLAYRDELIGLLRQLDKEGNEGARSFFLTAWNGKEPYTFDRIGRGLNRRIEAACLSLLGSIQPSVIGDYLRDAVSGGGGDGLMARFSLLTWPDVAGAWKNIDRLPDSRARERAFATFGRFEYLTPGQVGALSEFGDVHSLRFDPHAQACFDDWRGPFENRQRNGEANGIHPALIAHRMKYRKLIPAVALICHLADKPNGGPIDADAFIRALRWADYADSHAQRAYASVMRADLDAAREMLKRIRRGEVEDGFRRRDVYRNGWSRLVDQTALRKAADLLREFDYLRCEKDVTSGRWTERYRIHPALLAEALEYRRSR